MNEVKADLKKDRDLQFLNSNNFLYQKQIDSLSNEITFLREELKEKNFLIRSLMNKLDHSKSNNNIPIFKNDNVYNKNPQNPSIPFNLLDNEKNNRKKATNEHIDQAACAYDIDDTNITKRTKRNLVQMAESPTSTLETAAQKVDSIKESIEDSYHNVIYE